MEEHRDCHHSHEEISPGVGAGIFLTLIFQITGFLLGHVFLQDGILGIYIGTVIVLTLDFLSFNSRHY